MDPLYDSEDLFPQSPIAIRLEPPVPNCVSSKCTSQPYLLSMSGDLHSPDTRHLTSNELGFDCTPPSHHPPSQPHHHHHPHSSEHHAMSTDTLQLTNVSNDLCSVQNSSLSLQDCTSLSSTFSFDYLDGKLDHSMLGSVWTADTNLPALSGYELTSLDYATGAVHSLLEQPELSTVTHADLCDLANRDSSLTLYPLSHHQSNLDPLQSAEGQSQLSSSYVTHPDHLQCKPPDQWDHQDVSHFLSSLCVADLEGQSELHQLFGSYCGAQLLTFSRPQLCSIHSKLGSLLFDALHSLSRRKSPSLLL
jgi:hypothetical protein